MCWGSQLALLVAQITNCGTRKKHHDDLFRGKAAQLCRRCNRFVLAQRLR